MPFGLKNSQSKNKKYYIFRFVRRKPNSHIGYLDDVLIATKTVEENIAICKTVVELNSFNKIKDILVSSPVLPLYIAMLVP